MIHQVSIPAPEPRRVAEALAELMNVKCLPFRPYEGGFMAASDDANGTLSPRASLPGPRAALP